MSHLANTTITESGHANVTVHIKKKKKKVKTLTSMQGLMTTLILFFILAIYINVKWSEQAFLDQNYFVVRSGQVSKPGNHLQKYLGCFLQITRRPWTANRIGIAIQRCLLDTLSQGDRSLFICSWNADHLSSFHLLSIDFIVLMCIHVYLLPSSYFFVH